ncbi:hypothetical protein INR49_032501 [Caranx melampygus]|nr:hypothetical protein INR49_032501 [Caranx melampygus]
MCGVVSTEFPHLTADNFELTLASDELLVHFFNDFLSLPSFPEALLYNQETGLFEVGSGAAELVCRRIRSDLRRCKSQLLTGDPTMLTRTPPVDNHYTVSFLDREQGIQWIMEERFPFFLQSECYIEYRLAKLLYQWEPNLHIQRRRSSLIRATMSAPQLRCSSQSDRENNNALKTSSHSSAKQGFMKYNFTCLPHGQKDYINAKCRESARCFSSCSEPENPSGFSSLSCSYSSCSSDLKCATNRDLQSQPVELSLCFTEPPAGSSERQHLQESRSLDSTEVSQLQLEHLAASVVQQVLNNALNMMDQQSRQNICDCFSKSGGQMHRTSPEKPCESKVCQHSANGGGERLEGKKGKIQEGKRGEEWRRRRRRRTWSLGCVQGVSARNAGEKLINLWMDIEKLKATQHRERKNRLGLTTSPCWTEEKLCSVQPCLSEALLYYWAPRFWRSHCVQEDLKRTSNVGLWWQNTCQSNGHLHCDPLTLPPVLPVACLSQPPHTVPSQLLYSTYLYTSARRSIGVDEKIRRRVYDRLMPAFEELFDEVEEHTLNILLQPWTLLVNRDKESFQKMRVQEEVLRVENQEYRELQRVYEESERRVSQAHQSWSTLSLSPIASSSPSSKGHQATDSSSNVSPNYKGYRLGSLLRHRHEIRHFMSFLQNQDASIHLTCWLDLEQYRRTPHRDKAVKQERSSHIATQYLNRKYFFGPDSPASTEQQNDPQAADRLSQHVYHRRGTRRKAWKAEGLWMSSSKEILLFRQILLNPVTCLQFQHFVSMKGDFLENDMLFWLEVQRYKDLCHSHSDEAIIQQKISTIINCFINSSMPPSLQIDIPPEQAQRILEKRHELGPYIFREAQMSVFSELLKFWPEFQELSNSVDEEQLLPMLQEKRVKHRARVRRQRRKEEEEDEKKKRAQSAVQDDQESEESSCREVEEDTDNDMDDGEVEEEGRRSGRKQWRTQSRALLSPTQPLSWSYSKYMAALKREEVLLRRKSQLEASFSINSDSSSLCSVKSAGSKHSLRQSHRSSTADSKQCHRYNRACNMK